MKYVDLFIPQSCVRPYFRDTLGNKTSISCSPGASSSWEMLWGGHKGWENREWAQLGEGRRLCLTVWLDEAGHRHTGQEQPGKREQ